MDALVANDWPTARDAYHSAKWFAGERARIETSLRAAAGRGASVEGISDMQGKLQRLDASLVHAWLGLAAGLAIAPNTCRDAWDALERARLLQPENPAVGATEHKIALQCVRGGTPDAGGR